MAIFECGFVKQITFNIADSDEIKNKNLYNVSERIIPLDLKFTRM